MIIEEFIEYLKKNSCLADWYLDKVVEDFMQEKAEVTSADNWHRVEDGLPTKNGKYL